VGTEWTTACYEVSRNNSILVKWIFAAYTRNFMHVAVRIVCYRKVKTG